MNNRNLYVYKDYIVTENQFTVTMSLLEMLHCLNIANKNDILAIALEFKLFFV